MANPDEAGWEAAHYSSTASPRHASQRAVGRGFDFSTAQDASAAGNAHARTPASRSKLGGAVASEAGTATSSGALDRSLRTPAAAATPNGPSPLRSMSSVHLLLGLRTPADTTHPGASAPTAGSKPPDATTEASATSDTSLLHALSMSPAHAQLLLLAAARSPAGASPLAREPSTGTSSATPSLRRNGLLGASMRVSLQPTPPRRGASTAAQAHTLTPTHVAAQPAEATSDAAVRPEEPGAGNDAASVSTFGDDLHSVDVEGAAGVASDDVKDRLVRAITERDEAREQLARQVDAHAVQVKKLEEAVSAAQAEASSAAEKAKTQAEAVVVLEQQAALHVQQVDEANKELQIVKAALTALQKTQSAQTADYEAAQRRRATETNRLQAELVTTRSELDELRSVADTLRKVILSAQQSLAAEAREQGVAVSPIPSDAPQTTDDSTVPSSPTVGVQRFSRLLTAMLQHMRQLSIDVGAATADAAALRVERDALTSKAAELQRQVEAASAAASSQCSECPRLQQAVQRSTQAHADVQQALLEAQQAHMADMAVLQQRCSALSSELDAAQKQLTDRHPSTADADAHMLAAEQREASALQQVASLQQQLREAVHREHDLTVQLRDQEASAHKLSQQLQQDVQQLSAQQQRTLELEAELLRLRSARASGSGDNARLLSHLGETAQCVANARAEVGSIFNLLVDVRSRAVLLERHVDATRAVHEYDIEAILRAASATSRDATMQLATEVNMTAKATEHAHATLPASVPVAATDQRAHAIIPGMSGGDSTRNNTTAAIPPNANPLPQASSAEQLSPEPAPRAHAPIQPTKVEPLQLGLATTAGATASVAPVTSVSRSLPVLHSTLYTSPSAKPPAAAGPRVSPGTAARPAPISSTNRTVAAIEPSLSPRSRNLVEHLVVNVVEAQRPRSPRDRDGPSSRFAGALLVTSAIPRPIPVAARGTDVLGISQPTVSSAQSAAPLHVPGPWKTAAARVPAHVLPPPWHVSASQGLSGPSSGESLPPPSLGASSVPSASASTGAPIGAPSSRAARYIRAHETSATRVDSRTTAPPGMH